MSVKITNGYFKPLTEEEKIIKDHTDWSTGFFKYVYEQALRHGIKHGKELNMNKELTELVKKFKRDKSYTASDIIEELETLLK